MSFFRYPGGKRKLGDIIVKRLADKLKSSDITQYREPFFGGGSIGVKLMKEAGGNIKSIWINDIDPGIAALWTSVMLMPNALCGKISNYNPNVQDFDSFRRELTDAVGNNGTDDTLSLGLKKLIIHQISYSGLGTKSGGPLGGRSQASPYKIDCRWSPSHMIKKIKELNLLFKHFEIAFNKCTSYDFPALINDGGQLGKGKSLIYCDPPYFVKGEDLYQHSFGQLDHIRLAEELKKTRHEWLLSYDDAPEIRRLYRWAKIEQLNVKYSITTARQKKELLIHAK